MCSCYFFLSYFFLSVDAGDGILDDRCLLDPVSSIRPEELNAYIFEVYPMLHYSALKELAKAEEGMERRAMRPDRHPNSHRDKHHLLEVLKESREKEKNMNKG